MKKTELREIIANGENSGVEFKRDDVPPEKIAKECVAFANLKGGMIILGVEDHGTITGIDRPNCEEWVMDAVFGNYIHPRIIPYYEEVVIDENRRVGVIRISAGTPKPYVLRHKKKEDIYIRIGSTSQLASREQQLRLLQNGGLVHIEKLPVSGSSIKDLDLRKFEYYLKRIIEDNVIPGSSHQWQERLKSLDLIVDTDFSKNVGSIAGVLLFAKKPGDFLPNSGLRVTVYPASDKDYNMEITSFGGLPNTLTLKKIKAGQQYPGNPILIRFARDYGYMDDRGMGIRRKVIPLMIEHNKEEPIFEITEDYFKVILKKKLKES